ncbi:MAG TPA: hypothetical protein VKV27_16595 [Solirubrobacteraceae bacterium]|nr:hypothetical protein [Solirubrobacteraceae bacterium]
MQRTRGEDHSGELREVASAAHELLMAQGSEEPGALRAARERVLVAARRALDAGCSLAALAEAEQAGQERARGELRSQLLRRVERSARRLREADREHRDEIRRAAAVGLGTREIAEAAGLAYGTIRAIVMRSESDEHSIGVRSGPSNGADAATASHPDGASDRVAGLGGEIEFASE